MYTKISKNSENKKGGVGSLDKLELTSDSFLTQSHENQYRQAIRKQSTIAKLIPLINVCTEERKAKYWKTYHCNRVKLQMGGKLVGSLCRKRWCQNCNRIKSAELINGYGKPLVNLHKKESLWFVTLTAPTVSERQLKSELTKRYKAFSRIKDNLRKNYGIKLNGIRKTEIEYNEKEDKYHPHFHMIIQGRKEAELLHSLWLSQFKRADVKGQNIKPITMNDGADVGGLKELFKYVTKDVSKSDKEVKALDWIYTCLEGVRTIQTFGSIKKIKEPKESRSELNKCDWIEPKNEIWVYDEMEADYYDSKSNTLIGTNEINEALNISASINSNLTLVDT